MKVDNIEEARSAIIKLCASLQIDIHGIMLFGSYARGDHTEKSDVDLIILSERCESGFRMQVFVDKFPLQEIIISTSELIFKIKNYQSVSHPFLIDAISESIILMDRLGLSSAVKHIGQDVKNKGPSEVAAQQIEAMRIGIINILNNPQSKKYTGESKLSKTRWAAKIIDMLEDFFLTFNKEWVHYNERKKERLLLEKYPSFKVRMDKILEEFLESLDCVIFSRDLNLLLSEYVDNSWPTKPPYHASLI